MKTMYRVDYATCDAYYGFCNGEVIGDTYFNTIEEAQKEANKIKPTIVRTGSYTIVARTIDEEKFIVIDKVVKEFDYWKEVKRYEIKEKTIAYLKEEIKKLEEAKKRCRTENGIEKKNKEIEKAKKDIQEAKAIIKKWKEEA